MASKTSDIASALKTLRRETGLSQAQFASEVGLAPTSIYRYESGTRPEPAALFALARYAELKEFLTARNVFLTALGRTNFPRGTTFIDSGVFANNDADIDISVRLSTAVSQLSRGDKVEALAFIEFLRQNTDATTEKMIKVLLEPWRSEIQKRFPEPIDHANDTPSFNEK